MKRWIVMMCFMMLGLYILWQIDLTRDRIIFCDVGQGDGIILIQGSSQILVDSGPDNHKILVCLSQHLPFWDKKIEGVIVSHWDEDHSGGLNQVIRYYRIDGMYCPKVGESEFGQKNCSAYLGLGDILRLGKMEFVVLSAEEEVGEDNNNSVVGILSYKDGGKETKILLTGDAGLEVEQKMVWRGIFEERLDKKKLDILKVSHHGSGKGSSQEFLKAINPVTAIISVGKDNSFGHPEAGVLERLKTNRVEIRRTDEEGDIMINLGKD